MKHTNSKSLLKRSLVVAGWTVAAVVLLVALVAGTGYWLFFRQPPAASLPQPRDHREANVQDLEYLRKVMTLDRSFSPQARAAFNESIDRLIPRAAELDDASMEMEVTRAIALADNGHTTVRETTWGSQRLPHIPLRFGQFAEGLFVVKADPQLKDLLGAQLLAVDGQPVALLASKLRPFVGGPDALAHEFLPHLLATPPALHAVGLGRSAGEATLNLRLTDGRVVDRVVAVRPDATIPDNTFRWPKRALSPVPIPDDAGPWVHVLDGVTPLPAYLQHPNTRYWHIYMSDPELLYVQINRLLSEGDTPLDAYLAKVLTEIGERRPRAVVIDVRFSPGGNYQLAADFTRKLPAALPENARIFVLMSGNTFSAALITVARLKYFGGPRVTLVGSPPGDREQFWAEGNKAQLPNSGITVAYTTGYHDWEHGCRNLSKCFWPNLFEGVAAGKLSVDVPAPLRFSDYLSGRDSGIEAIRQALQH